MTTPKLSTEAAAAVAELEAALLQHKTLTAERSATAAQVDTLKAEEEVLIAGVALSDEKGIAQITSLRVKLELLPRQLAAIDEKIAACLDRLRLGIEITHSILMERARNVSSSVQAEVEEFLSGLVGYNERKEVTAVVLRHAVPVLEAERLAMGVTCSPKPDYMPASGEHALRVLRELVGKTA